jgi:hypothetical protein
LQGGSNASVSVASLHSFIFHAASLSLGATPETGSWLPETRKRYISTHRREKRGKNEQPESQDAANICTAPWVLVDEKRTK